MRPNTRRLLSLSLLAASLSACSVMEGEKIDYKSAKAGNALEIPPDLSRSTNSSRYQIPQTGVASASDFASKPAVGSGVTNTEQVAVNSLPGVRLERQGQSRWLVVDMPAARLWDELRGFWQDNGFLIDVDNAELGVMETDWAENRAKLPQDFVRETLGKLIDSLYSTGELDKFRTRVERNAQGQLEVSISHRGMVEVYSSNDKTSTKWQPRDSDLNLENEFLRRLMLRLGAPEAQAQQATAAVKTGTYAQATAGGIVIRDSLAGAWRRVGLALDRNGFTVVKREEASASYDVRYVPSADAPAAKPGFLERLFGSKPKAQQAVDLRLELRSQGDMSALKISGADAQAVARAQDLLLQDMR